MSARIGVLAAKRLVVRWAAPLDTSRASRGYACFDVPAGRQPAQAPASKRAIRQNVIGARPRESAKEPTGSQGETIR